MSRWENWSTPFCDGGRVPYCCEASTAEVHRLLMHRALARLTAALICGGRW
eukprot:gene5237-1288_t